MVSLPSSCINGSRYKYQSAFGSIQSARTVTLEFMLFSLPEPKAHGELILYQSSRRLPVCLCVATLSNINISAIGGPIAAKFYLKHNGCVMFWFRCDLNSGFHGNR